METSPQKIIKLEANNVQVLKAFSIDAEGDSVVIKGKNGSGKTTALNAIQYALSGGRSFTNVEEMINRNAKEAVEAGEAKSEIIIETDDFVVRRWWTANDKSYIKLKSKGVGELKSVQSLLDKLYSSLNFDPLSIADKGADEQRKLLLEYLDVEEDYESLQSEYEAVYQERRDVGRDKKKAEARFESIEDPGDNIPDRVDLKETYDELEERRKHNDELDDIKRRRDEREQSLIDTNKSIRHKKAEIEQLKKELNELEQQKSEFDKAVAHLEDKIDEFEKKPVDELKSKIANAEDINHKNDKREKYLESKKQVKDLQETYSKMSSELEFIEEQKAQLLDSDDLPLDGLSVGESGLKYEGFPLSDCSTAERIKVGIGILVAKDPVLRAFTIRDASVLDENSLALVRELCDEYNLQAFYESTVDLGDELPQVKIVDGNSVGLDTSLQS